MVCSAGSQLTYAQGTVMSEVKVSSALDGVLDRKGSLFMTNGAIEVFNCALLSAV